jgi:hypothetical protein
MKIRRYSFQVLTKLEFSRQIKKPLSRQGLVSIRSLKYVV